MFVLILWGIIILIADILSEKIKNWDLDEDYWNNEDWEDAISYIIVVSKDTPLFNEELTNLYIQREITSPPFSTYSFTTIDLSESLADRMKVYYSEVYSKQSFSIKTMEDTQRSYYNEYKDKFRTLLVGDKGNMYNISG